MRSLTDEMRELIKKDIDERGYEYAAKVWGMTLKRLKAEFKPESLSNSISEFHRKLGTRVLLYRHAKRLDMRGLAEYLNLSVAKTKKLEAGLLDMKLSETLTVVEKLGLRVRLDGED